MQASAEVEITVEEDAVSGCADCVRQWEHCGKARRPREGCSHPAGIMQLLHCRGHPLPACCCFYVPVLLLPPCPCLQMDRMEKSIESVRRNFASVRTGRANPAMLDRIEVGAARVLPAAAGCCLLPCSAAVLLLSMPLCKWAAPTYQ